MVLSLNRQISAMLIISFITLCLLCAVTGAPTNSRDVKYQTTSQITSTQLDAVLRSGECAELQELFKRLLAAEKDVKNAKNDLKDAEKTAKSYEKALGRAQKKLPGVEKAVTQKEKLVNKLQSKFDKLQYKENEVGYRLRLLKDQLVQEKAILQAAIANEQMAKNHLNNIAKEIAAAPSLTSELKKKKRAAVKALKKASRAVKSATKVVEKREEGVNEVEEDFNRIHAEFVKIQTELEREKRGLDSLKFVVATIKGEISAAQTNLNNALQVVSDREAAVDAAELLVAKVKAEIETTECQ